MKKKYIVITLSLVIAFLTGCQQQSTDHQSTKQQKTNQTEKNEIANDWQKFTSNQFKLSFNYPNNWSIEEFDFGMLSINPPKSLIDSEEIIFDMGMFIDENTENVALSFDDVIKFTKNYYDDSSYYKVMSEQEINLQNIKVYSAVYMKRGGELKKSQISFLYENQIYGIRFYAPENIHNEYLSIFEKIINSIIFLENK